MKKGKVYLVGAGPGNPNLITVAGLECIKHADVIVYDRLVDESILEAASENAEKIFMGKSSGCSTREQAEINHILVAKAREGKTVVRLKGGDPFVLGRGGEEAEVLVENNIPFEVVPGITSAIAVPAYAGITLTHRDMASSFAVITGHEAEGKFDSSIDWKGIACGADTLVFLMGMANLDKIAARLIKHGRKPETPVALIQSGTTPQQKTLSGTLENIARLAKENGFKPPAVFVVGEVVKLREKLKWFDTLPLFARRVLVTRATKQADEPSRLLSERGAIPVCMPAINIIPPDTWEEMDRAIQNLSSYQWVVFTSVNGVEFFFQRLHALNQDARKFGGIKVGAIGPATAKALVNYGLHPDYVPGKYTSRGFLDGLKKREIEGCNVLLPRAAIASREMADGIVALGGKVHEITAYRTVVDTESNSPGREMLLKGEIDVVTFTSPSTVANLLTILGSEWQTIGKTTVACIGPTTAKAAKEHGLKVDIVAAESTIHGLVEAMENYFKRDKS